MPSVDILTHQSHICKVGQHNLANITSALQRLVTLKLSIIIKHYYDNNNVSENQSRIRLLNFSWHLCRSMKFEFSITLRTLRIMAKLSEFVAKYLFALFYQFLITSMRVNTCNTIFNVDSTFTKAAVKLSNALHCVWRTQMSHTKKIHLMFHFSPGIGLSDLASITKCITHFSNWTFGLSSQYFISL